MPSVSAAPQDAQVVHGSAAIDQQGDLTTIQASHNSVINYSAFSILPQETVRFVQPGASSRVLNRVTGPERSLIQGHLQANGIVYLVNPAGVYFAKGSVVDVAGLYAAAGHISNEDYLAGNDLFAQVSGSVVNEGTLQGRAVHLIGRSVANRGSITASDGIVTLLAGDEVYVREQGGRVLVRIDGFDVGEGGQPSAGGSAPSTGGEAGVDQSGSIRADRGRVVLGAGDLYSLAVRNSGSVAAAGGGVRVAAADGAVVNTGRLSADTQSGQGGLVEVAAPSIVSSGSITADTHRGAAGSVRLVGHNHTYLLDGSRTSASGGSGGASGGGVLVNSVAGLTLFASGARIDVSSGRGLGSGGSVELSGVSMVFNGSVDLQGVSAHGSLLLDPGDLTVADIGTQDPLAGDGVIDFNEPDSVTDVTISDEALEAVVGHIRLAAARDLFVNHPVNLAGNNDLTLQANRHLQVNAAIQGSGGSGRFVATADADGDGAGDLALNAPVSGFLSATLDGAAVTLNATPIQTAGLQLYHAPVVLGADTTLIASGVRFKAAVDAAAGGEAPALTIEGSAAFDAPVGAVQPLQSLDVLGAATINGGVFSTVGPQSFRDAVTVNGDTTLNASGVTLGDSLDAAKAGVGAVTISGTALFSGPVGSTRALGSLDVVGETTIHGGSITTTGQQTYHQAVTVGREGVALGGSGVHFGSTVDLKEPDESEPGEGFVPVLEVSGTGFEIHGPRVMRDGVVVAVGTTLAAEGDDDGGEGTTEPGALQIHAGADGVFFGGEVGGSTALQSIGVVSAGLVTIRGDLVRTWGGISLNPQGVAEVPTVATIAAPAGGLRIQSVDGDVVMGQNQKLTALGDLTIEAAGRAALGDLNALGHTTVHASAIELQTREAGLVLNPQGGLDPDEGVDYVTGGNFDFNVAPTAVGEGGQPRFSAQGPASGPLASASNIVYLQHRGLSASQFTRGSTVLDLRATGSPAPPPDGSTNLSEALDGPVRRASFADDVLEELRLKEADAQALRELGIGARPLRGSEIAGGLEGRHFYDDTLVGTLGGGGEQAGVALPRLSRAPALEAARRYREVFFEQVVDDQTGELRWQDRSDYIRAVLEEAWNAYVASSPDAAADASGFRAYLGAQPDYASALRFLDHLSGLVAVLRSIGLTAREFQVCEVSLLNRVKPSSMDLEELERAIGGAVQQSAERDRGMVSVAGR
jgi:filamentous hemagglutinin family protein